MAKKIVTPPATSAVAPINTVINVRPFVSFTVYAASTAVVSLSPDDGATWVTGPTVPAAGYVTISDAATAMKCDHTCRVVGLYAYEGD